MSIKITSTNKHAEFVKVCVYGQSGVGKTTLAKTAPDPIIISAEGGLMCLADSDIPAIEIKTVEDLDSAYDYVVACKHKTICLDSISEIAEAILSNEKKNTRDGRAAYGATNDLVAQKIRKFRDIKNHHLYFTAKAIRDEDGCYAPSMPGKRMSNELPYFFDLLLALRIGEDDELNTYRYLQTQPDLKWSCKDRSGKLNMIERPNLTLIFNKIKGVNKPKATEEEVDDYA